MPHLEPVDLPQGKVLYECGSLLSHAFFPTTCVVGLAYVMQDGASAEMAIVGLEGAIGVALFMGGELALTRAVVHGAGTALRLKAGFIQEEFARNPRSLTLLLRFTQALIVQIAHTAVCNRHHSVDQQLCRLLLLILDRVHGSELLMTQEALAGMLGVRREGVTESAYKLQAAGAMKYTRGRITILDRNALEARTCECYGVVKRAYYRLLQAAPPAAPSPTPPAAALVPNATH
jgi:CRP-like cAMP-binding protein